MSEHAQRPRIESASREWMQQVNGALARLQAAVDELPTVFAQTADAAKRTAARATDTLARAELKTRPLPDLDELIVRLAREGPAALTTRERKALVSVPGRLDAHQLSALLDSESLVRHAARIALMQWPDYAREPWGVHYETVILTRVREAQIRLLGGELSASALLSRSEPLGNDSVAALLPRSSMQDAHEHLKGRLGVRDSWLFCSSVLAAWLRARFREGLPLDDSISELMSHERLRALLLPPLRSASANLPVRSSTAIQAQVVALALGGAFANPPQLRHGLLASLVDYLVKSTFEDPRSRMRSDGWAEVSRLNQPGFRRLLASLCEQDLEVFFQHAMNEPDRRRFWLRYLGSIERTGCVLDVDLRRSLHARVAEHAELSSAIDRAFVFSRRSNVQAFFMLFADHAVIEFSDTGNAAYVYRKEYFIEKMEPRIFRRVIEGVGYLKMSEACVERIAHAPGWESRAGERLAALGIHPRR